MTTKDKLREIVDSLGEVEVDELLDYAYWLVEKCETLTPAELARVREGEEQIRRGDFTTLDALRHDLGL
jgi:hypothetical protein